MKPLYIISILQFFVTTVALAQRETNTFDYKIPTLKLVEGQHINRNKFLRSYLISGYRARVNPIPGLVNFQRYDDPVSGTARIAMYNLSIVEMLIHMAVDPSEVVLEVKDPSKYMYDPKYGDKASWVAKNVYCFEYTMPVALIAKKVSPDNFSPFIWEQQLFDLFGINMRREKRLVKTTSGGEHQQEVYVITELSNR